MSRPRIATHPEWLAARQELAAKESGLASARDTVVAQRRKLPMVRVERDYAFDGPDGRRNLLELFEGRRQLLVYHFWFQPGEDPCGGCTLWVSDLGDLRNLHERGDTALAMVSRASSGEIEAAKRRKGWTVPWFSVVGEDFNDDADYAGVAQITVFLRDGEAVFRTYVTSGSVLETVGNHWTLLDLTPLGLEAHS